jgi:hypothetical protein
MLRIHVDFNEMTPDGEKILIATDDKRHERLVEQLSPGMRVIVIQNAEFEVEAVAEIIKVHGHRQFWYGMPDWSTRLDYSEMPIERLGLSQNAIQIIKRSGIESVGDCIDYLIHRRSAMTLRNNPKLASHFEKSLPHQEREVIFGRSLTTPEYSKTMETEVKEKLQEHGYWQFYEDFFKDE